MGQKALLDFVASEKKGNPDHYVVLLETGPQKSTYIPTPLQLYNDQSIAE